MRTSVVDIAILAVRASDGTPIWSFPTEHGLSSAFLLDQGTLYAVDDAGIIYAVDALKGTEKWTIALHEDEPYSLTWYGAPLMLDGKLVFSAGSTMAVAAGENAVFVGRPADDWIEGTPIGRHIRTARSAHRRRHQSRCSPG